MECWTCEYLDSHKTCALCHMVACDAYVLDIYQIYILNPNPKPPDRPDIPPAPDI